MAYRAYLLRLWLMDNNGCPQWRVSLEEAHGDTPVHFRGLAEFLAYLLAAIENDDNAQHDRDD